MFEITIKGDTMAELIERAAELSSALDQVAAGETPAAPRAKATKTHKPKAPSEPPAVKSDEAPASDEVDAQLLEPADPMPATAKAVVDAGTGKPVGASDEPIRMTFDDVKVAAARLAAKDTPALSALLQKYGAGRLSEVPKAQLGDFAADVMERLG